MLFDDTHPLQWKPFYIQAVRLYWTGETRSTIAATLGIGEATVTRIIESDRGRQILASLEANVYDSMLEVQTMAQAVAVEVMREKVNLALHSPNENVRTKNTADLLAIAGHVPTHKVSISRADPVVEKYKDKTELDLRRELMELVGADRGPDGHLVN